MSGRGRERAAAAGVTRAAAVLAVLTLSVPAAAAPDPAGFIHGTVETKNGTSFTGLIRWDNEETFWDDLFNATKTELELLERHGREEEQERSSIRIFGITIGYRTHQNEKGRVFIARFGDVSEIRPGGGDGLELTMRSGSVWRLEGGSNDVGAVIVVRDASLGQVELEWDNLRRVRFSPAPPRVVPTAQRLQGRVLTGGETYQGFIQWDLQECLGTDELDGDTPDGEVAIEMRNVRAIEKRDRHGSWVELRDGRRLLLEDTNDVDSDLRGIFVEDERYGRVEIPWDEFRRAEFEESDRSGPGYASYETGGKLRGKVSDVDGRAHEGTLVFDLDESESWEILNGKRGGVDFSIPFARIRSIEPRGTRASRVVLKDGTELELEQGQDVTESNEGVLVQGAGGEIHLPWSRIRRIELR